MIDNEQLRKISERYPIVGSKVGQIPETGVYFDQAGYLLRIQRIELVITAAFAAQQRTQNIEVRQSRGERRQPLAEFYELASDLDSCNRVLIDLAEEMRELRTRCFRGYPTTSER